MSAQHTPGPWLIDADDMKQDPETVFSIGIWSGNSDPNSDDSTMVATVAAFGLHSEMHDGCEYVTAAEPELRDVEIAIANARLIAAAPDHAMFARALLTGAVIWRPFDGSSPAGELIVGGLCYATRLDEFGVPILRGHLRAAIAKSTGGAA